jgi:hypothetical protein
MSAWVAGSLLTLSGFGWLAPVPDLSSAVDHDQPSLEDAAGRFAGLWSLGDVGRITDLLASEGIRLHLGRVGHNSLPPRQARAALRDFLGEHRSDGVRLDTVSEVGGSPPRGFAEISWETVVLGTSETLHYIVFVGFILEDEIWRISEVRVFR